MNVAVIGAGPAGMMAAFVGAKNNNVVLFEKNEKLGKKLYITGKGRCNLTNYSTPQEFFPNIIRNKKFLYSSIYSLDSFYTMEIFKSYGLDLKVERGNRVFPKSDKSSDVIKTYMKMLKSRYVLIKLNENIFNIEKKYEKFILNNKYEFDKVVISTGGLSYKMTGSTGDGYKFAKSFNHNIIKPVAALNAILLKDKFNLAGLSLKNVELYAYSNGKLISREFGEMLFTHEGISGPIVLSISSKINRVKNIKLSLDLKPALDYNKLDNRLLREFVKNNNKDIKNILKEVLPLDLIEIILKNAEISVHKKANQITKEERYRLILNIKNFPLHFQKIENINRAVITSGGVDVSEINPSTMESKLVKGLYFCGEVLDVDALTGGYNIQIANSTGYLCGENL